MSNLTVYCRSQPSIYLQNPASEQVVEHLRLLDGSQLLYMRLITDRGYLTILASEEGRMYVYFTDGVHDGYLIDENQPEQPLIDFRLDNGQIDEWSLRETVSREIAGKVATYFLLNDTFPEGLSWEGNMQGLD